MKRAFTLIELLVVIAIIAILAAILFPVFAQAKVAAKKTQIVSGQKQINMGIQLYMGDNDDVLPRQDGCQANSSLNPALNTLPAGGDPSGWCKSGSPDFRYRMNHFSWQKWIMPYVKSVDFFIHPGFGKNDTQTTSCPTGQWSGCGQITGSCYLNLSLTGALNTYGPPFATTNLYRNSFRGGTISGLPSPSSTMLLMEGSNANIAFVPTVPGVTSGDSSINYPAAYREVWELEFGIRKPAAGCGTWRREAFAAGTTIGFADGSVKWFPAGKFLAATPTMAEYGAPQASYQSCGFTGGTAPLASGNGVPLGVTNNIQYPLWALGD